MGLPPLVPVPLSAGPAPVVVPKSFELYVDGARWLLAIIAGLLVFGFDAIKAHPGQGLALGLYAGSAILLAVAAGAALVYLLASYNYASRREGGQPKDDPQVLWVKAQSDRYFATMIWNFLAGLALFVAFGAALLWGVRGKEEIVQLHAGGVNSPIIQKGDRFWVLAPGPSGQLGWVALPPPPDGEAITR